MLKDDVLSRVFLFTVMDTKEIMKTEWSVVVSKLMMKLLTNLVGVFAKPLR